MQNELWDYAREIVFKKDFKEFSQKFYDIRPDR
jgi:hypothetical protein